MKILFLPILLLSFGITLVSNVSCVKEVEKIITVRDTIIVLKRDTLTIKDFVKDSATTLIISRHAETSGLGSNPNLSAAGMERANELARILKPNKLNQVYSSNFNRTIQTATPAANNNSLSPIIYDPNNQADWIQNVIQNNKNKNVLILGHSNTVPALLNILTGSNQYTLIPDTEYNNLFIVVLSEKGKANVIHMKYGS